MIGIFCGSKASNNEEFKKVIKARMARMAVIFIIGIITLTVTFLPKSIVDIKMSEYIIATYRGLGVGLTVVSVILWIKNRIILTDEAKLKSSWVSNTDERILEISNGAFRVATFTLLIGLYAVGLIGGLFYPILVKVLFMLISLFLFIYVIAYRYYEWRM